MAGILTIGAVAAAASSVAAIGSWAWIRLKQIRQVRGNEPESEARYSPERYEPMTRLLAQDEWEFVQRRTACRPGVAARWNRERRKIFRLYLNDLARDFYRLHAAARALVAESPQQHSDLVGVLMRQQVTFWRVMAAMECRLLLHAMGIGRVDARALLQAMEAMRLEIDHSLHPASA